MAKRIHVVLLLDKSSSMAGTKDQTISGYNEQVSQIKIDSKGREDVTTVSLITFDADVFEHLWMEPVEKLEEADPSSYKPNGMTSLRDAMAYGILKLSESIGPEDDVLAVLISDGDDTSSSKYSEAALKELVDGKKLTGHWTFTYMGCTAMNLAHVSASTGIPLSNMARWNNGQGAAARAGMQGTAKAIGKYLAAKAADPDAPIIEGVYALDRESFVDFTGTPDELGIVGASVSDLGGSEVKLNAALAASHRVPDRGDDRAGPTRMSFAGPVGAARVGRRTLLAASAASHLEMAALGTPEVVGVQDVEPEAPIRRGTSKVFAHGTKAVWTGKT